MPKGTWTTTGSTASVAGVGLVVIIAMAIAWAVPRLAWILGALAAVVAAAAVFALVVVPRIGAWADRRGAVAYAAARPVQAATEPVQAIAPLVQEPAVRQQEPASAQPPAIANHYGPEFHIYGDGREAAARLIRQALTPEPPDVAGR